ncbi:polysaccharide deacetylase family sporulation protein PdaB [Hydrogenispora ethanolica]|uniref:Polysaccharide deacetylase family sporulation protein PdaB n=1 Tax=Hydrogenispora ethanolica TaxID=1082276 RepID=A0A4R1REA0_HYDET|nr:polysaccharide deacetylase family protein [Hydrogenispora ethanolica]TCL64238.1 polysaccharide deacetylase family sporulation protein PdaB [Hydrogenispora ethanolica]
MRIFYFRSILWVGIGIALVFSLGYLAGRFHNENWPTMGLLAKEMPLFYVKKSAPEVCLTFDISWGEKTLPLVLKVLKQNQTPATFFVSGPWAVRHPEAVRAIVNDGHEIASHGDRHINLSQVSKDVVHDNIAKAHQDILSVAGRVAPYFRPPNGDYDDVVIDTARELGYETVIWSVDTLDWKNPGPRYMIDRVLARTIPGAIILCHASDSSQEIHLALPGIISGLRAKGLKLVALSQLAANGELIRRDPR